MRPEHRVPLAIGVLVLAGGLAGLGLLVVVAPDAGRGVLLQIAAHAALGKETGIPVGLAAGVPPAVAWAYAVAQDATVLLVGFPLALLLRDRLERTRRGAALFRAVEARARSTTPRAETAGAVALAATTWIPMLPTGALFAALVGALLGIRARVLLPLLVGASAIACFAYTLAYGRLFSAAGASAAWVPLAIAGGVVFLFAVGSWLASRRRPVA